MKTKSSRRSIGALRRMRAETEFYGREDPLRLFRDNLSLDDEDPQRRPIFNVYGQGGVGKSSLKRQYVEMARQRGLLTADVTESQTNALEVMAHMASQLAEQGWALESFERSHEEYRQKRRHLEDQADTPPQVASFMARTLTKGGVGLMSQIPGLGMLSPFISADDLAKESEKALGWIYGKLSKKEDRELIANPLGVLTPLFMSDLQEVAEERGVALFFDTYERTGEYLEPWLLGKTAVADELPANSVVVVAGRNQLDRHKWADYEGLIVRQPLEPFSEAEARDFLARKKIADQATVDIILRLSGGLPLLLAMLATGNPNDPTAAAGVNETAVDRFLLWVEDAEQRALVLDAALPRLFNLDVLTALGAERAEAQFDWLKQMPFVQERPEGWIYHSVVRDQMLQYEFRKSPREWGAMHGRLADYYERLREQLGLEEAKGWLDTTWQRHALDVLYHRLCQAPHARLPGALNGFVRALKSGLSFARRWAETVQQAGRDGGRDAEEAGVKSWGDRLVEAVKAYVEDRHADGAKSFTRLLGGAPLETEWRAEALDWRGICYGNAKEFERALADFTEATALVPESEEYRRHRGYTSLLMGRLADAMDDLNYVIEKNPDDRLTLSFRSSLHLTMGSPDEALADIDRYLASAPDDVDALLQRSRIHILTGEFDKALADIARCEELSPDNVLVPSMKIGALMQKGDLAQVVELYATMAEDENARKYIRKLRELVTDAPAEMLQLDTRSFSAKLGLDQNRMLSDLLRLAAEGEEYGVRSLRAEAAVMEGTLHGQNGDLDAALASFKRAAEFAPDNADHWVRLGGIHGARNELAEAVECFTRALELDPDNASALGGHWQVYNALNDPASALADLDRLVALHPDNLLLLTPRLAISRQMSDFEESAKTLRKIGERAREFVEQYAASLPPAPPADAPAPASDPPAEPAADDQQARYLEAVRNDPEEAVRLLLAEVAAAEGDFHLVSDEMAEALKEYNKAVELDSAQPVYALKRAVLNALMRRFAEALEDFARLPEASFQNDDTRQLRARSYQMTGRHEEALADLDPSKQTDPEDDLSRYLRAVSYRLLGREAESREELSAATERAAEERRDDPEDRTNLFNLALYRLFAGDGEEAERLYREGLGGESARPDLSMVIYDLECLLELFPALPRGAEVLGLLREARAEASDGRPN